MLLSLLLVLTLPTVVQAQFRYEDRWGTITITGYDCPVGAATIPSTIDDLPVTSIGDSAFYRCASLASVTIPDSVDSIGAWAFLGCSNLASVTIPSSVTDIGLAAFLDCTSLTSAMIPSSVTSIGYGTFLGCTSLASVTIPSSVSDIGERAFQGCTSLASVTIPSGINSIGLAAFSGCSSLTSVTIPSSITNIGESAFYGCPRLASVYFQGNAPTLGQRVFDTADNVTVYYLPKTTGWRSTFGGRPTALWKPQVQASDTSFGVQTNQFGFHITWANNTVVVVEACTDLAQPIWSPMGTNTLTDSTSDFSDPQWTNHPTRFYRLRSP